MGYNYLMKTTVELDSTLLQAAKQRALDTNTSLKHVLEQALRQLLRPADGISIPIRTITFGKTTAPWPLADTKMRSHAYAEQSEEYLNKRVGFIPSRNAGSK
jgi:hypothetical protein